MALDATIAGAASNSYLTVAQASAYAAADLGRAAVKWAAAGTTVDQRERALQRATRDLDEYLQTAGDPYDADQALLFPRAIDTDASGPFLPKQILRACYEQAAYVLLNADVLDDAETRRARGLVTFGDGGVSGTLSTDADFGTISPRALRLLAAIDQGATVGRIELS